MPRSTMSGLSITSAVAAFYNYQPHPPSVEAEVNVYATVLRDAAISQASKAASSVKKMSVSCLPSATS
jgi:hypothetical protein